MTNWTPRLPNRLGSPDAPHIVSIVINNGLATFTFTATQERSYRLEYTR